MLANFQICISVPLMIERLLNKSYLENKTTRLRSFNIQKRV